MSKQIIQRNQSNGVKKPMVEFRINAVIPCCALGDSKLPEFPNSRYYKHSCEYLNTPHITIFNCTFFQGKQKRVHEAIMQNKHEIETDMLKQFFSTFESVFLAYPRLEIVGTGDTKFLSVVYDVLSAKSERRPVITKFRTAFYNYIFKILKPKQTSEYSYDTSKTQQTHNVVYKIDGESILVLPEYNFGVGNWKPHLTLCSLSDLKDQIPDLYYNLIIEDEDGYRLTTTDVDFFFPESFVPRNIELNDCSPAISLNFK